MNLIVVIVVALAGVVVVGAAAALVGRWLYIRQIRMSLVGLARRREAALASARGLEAILGRLAAAKDEEIEAFAADPANEDRHAIAEVANRMRINTDELQGVALPKVLWPVADKLQTVCAGIVDAADGVGEAGTAEGALDGLGAIDLQRIFIELRAVSEQLDMLLAQYKVEDPAVYGGGLYI